MVSYTRIINTYSGDVYDFSAEHDSYVQAINNRVYAIHTYLETTTMPSIGRCDNAITDLYNEVSTLDTNINEFKDDVDVTYVKHTDFLGFTVDIDEDNKIKNNGIIIHGDNDELQNTYESSSFVHIMGESNTITNCANLYADGSENELTNVKTGCILGNENNVLDSTTINITGSENTIQNTLFVNIMGDTNLVENLEQKTPTYNVEIFGDDNRIENGALDIQIDGSLNEVSYVHNCHIEGNSNKVSTIYDKVIIEGFNNIVSKDSYSVFISGHNNQSSYMTYSFIYGNNNNVSYLNNTQIIGSNIKDAQLHCTNSTIIGYNNTVGGNNNVVVAIGTYVNTDNCVVLGTYAKVSNTSYNVVIGDGNTTANPHNALLIKRDSNEVSYAYFDTNIICNKDISANNLKINSIDCSKTIDAGDIYTQGDIQTPNRIECNYLEFYEKLGYIGDGEIKTKIDGDGITLGSDNNVHIADNRVTINNVDDDVNSYLSAEELSVGLVTTTYVKSDNIKTDNITPTYVNTDNIISPLNSQTANSEDHNTLDESIVSMVRDILNVNIEQGGDKKVSLGIQKDIPQELFNNVINSIPGILLSENLGEDITLYNSNKLILVLLRNIQILWNKISELETKINTLNNTSNSTTEDDDKFLGDLPVFPKA